MTYVCARIAAFGHDDAATIAQAAQHVDDAISDAPIPFDNGALYTRISSAHRSLNLHNQRDVQNRLVWLPFHFLPGNGSKPAGEDPEGKSIEKLICLPAPESPIAHPSPRPRGRRCPARPAVP